MPTHLRTELDKLKNKLLDLSTQVHGSLNKAVLSVKGLDSVIAREVIEVDHKIDQAEVEVEEDCLKILALYQPVANDLRFVVATLKINNDLERIGDLAVNVSERTIYLSKTTPVKIPFDFGLMSEKSSHMLKRAIDAFIKQDVKLAHEVWQSDDEVDEINSQMYDRVYSEIRRSPQDVEALIHYLSISRHLERIADYATNICEDVIYMVEGRIIRHQPEKF